MSAPRRYAARDGDHYRCTDCRAIVALVRLSFGEEVVELAAGPAVRKPEAERDGVPCYAASRHRRHADDRIAAERWAATRGGEWPADHHPIEVPTFDTWCPGCTARVRVETGGPDNTRGAILQ